MNLGYTTILYLNDKLKHFIH